MQVLEAADIQIRVSLHGLRRTFNNISRQVAGETITKAIVGHVTDKMTEHYSFVEKIREKGSCQRHAATGKSK